MNENLILAAVFVAVLILSFTVISILNRRREIAQNIEASRSGRRESSDRIDKMLGSENELLRYYLDVMKNDKPTSQRVRMLQAGYISKSAPAVFTMIRVIAAIIAFVVTKLAIAAIAPAANSATSFILSMTASAMVFILTNAVLDNKAKKRTIEFRKLFPDFMDLLIVCIDSGLSIEAALDRVTREFLLTKPDFGLQLSIIGLEIRAGRPLHEALTNFSERVKVEEARSLSVLFRQSQELGTSVTKTLRVFSKEMRQMRLVRAEEKANALPVKMLFPLATCLFPVNLIIVLVPIMIAIMKMMASMSPS